MKNFKNVSVDETTGIVTAEMGCTLGDIDRKTAPWHVPMGIYSNTGSGLLLAGGFGYQIRKRGYSVDNILSAKVVTADGSYLTVSKTENSDLFWGIRGAGSTLCVVTEITLQAYKNESILLSVLAWPVGVDPLRECIKFVDQINDEDLMTYVALSFAPGTTQKVVVLQFMYFGEKEKAEKILEPMMSTSPIVVMPLSSIPFMGLQTLYDQDFGDRFWHFTGGSIKNNTVPDSWMEEAVAAWKNFPADITKGLIALEQRGGKGCRAPEEGTALYHRDSSWDWILMVGWDNKEDSQQMNTLVGNARNRLFSCANCNYGPTAANSSHLFKMGAAENFWNKLSSPCGTQKKI